MDSPSDSELHFRQLESMYHSAPINQTIPSCLTVSKGHAQVHFKVGETYWHSADGMHGSMYFKGLDDAAFFAANSMVEGVFVLTAKFEVELVSVVTCENLKAVGYFDRREGRKLWAHSELFNDQGQLVARGKGLFIVSDIELAAVNGYEAPAE